MTTDPRLEATRRHWDRNDLTDAIAILVVAGAVAHRGPGPNAATAPPSP